MVAVPAPVLPPASVSPLVVVELSLPPQPKVTIAMSQSPFRKANLQSAKADDSFAFDHRLSGCDIEHSPSPTLALSLGAPQETETFHR